MIVDQLISILLSGITLGSIYALMSFGLSLMWGTLKILNWAHGALFMFGGYLAWVFINIYNCPYIISLLISLLVLFLVGAGLYFSIIRPFVGNANFLFTTIMTTLGFQLMSESVALIIFGSRYKKIEAPIIGKIIVGVSALTSEDILIILTTTACFSLLYFFLNKTRHGLAIRAVAQDLDGAKIIGINVDRIYAYTIGVAAVLAALAGILTSGIYFLEPHIGYVPMMKAFVVIVLGGLGSLKGTIISAYIVGIVEAAASLFIGLIWSLPTLFLLMMIILLIRPQGLFGYE